MVTVEALLKSAAQLLLLLLPEMTQFSKDATEPLMTWMLPLVDAMLFLMVQSTKSTAEPTITTPPPKLRLMFVPLIETLPVEVAEPPVIVMPFTVSFQSGSGAAVTTTV